MRVHSLAYLSSHRCTPPEAVRIAAANGYQFVGLRLWPNAPGAPQQFLIDRPEVLRDRDRLRTVLSWPEDSAGGLMNTDTVSVRPDVTLETVLRYLRMRGEIPEKTDALFVVNRHDRYLGVLDLAAGIARTSRLSCQIVLTEGMDGLTVRIPPESNDMSRF